LNFQDEDPDTLEYRQSLDEIGIVHQKNFLLHSKILLSQNKLVEALRVLDEALDKLDHKDWDCLKMKLQILLIRHDYNDAKLLLNDMKEYFEEDETKLAQVDALEKETAERI